MSSQSKLRQSRERWKLKASARADDNRYLRKELARVKNEREQLKKGYVRVKCGISKVSVFSIGYQYSKILLKVIQINCSKDLIIFFHT